MCFPICAAAGSRQEPGCEKIRLGFVDLVSRISLNECSIFADEDVVFWSPPTGCWKAPMAFGSIGSGEAGGEEEVSSLGQKREKRVGGQKLIDIWLV